MKNIFQKKVVTLLIIVSCLMVFGRAVHAQNECQDDSQCGENQTCQDGTCVDDTSSGGSGNSCSSPDECGSNQDCVNGTCQDINSGDGSYSSYSECIKDDNDPGDCCDTSTNPESENWTECSEDYCSSPDDCDTGDNCVNHECVTPSGAKASGNKTSGGAKNGTGSSGNKSNTGTKNTGSNNKSGSNPNTAGTNNNGNPNTPGTNSCPANYSNVNGLCVPNSPFSGGLAASKDLPSLIASVLTILLTLAGVIAVVFLILGGYWYITAGGNEEMSEKGRKALTNAIIGLVIIMLSYAIVRVVTSFLTSGKPL